MGALSSCNSGGSAPSYLQTFLCWWNTTPTNPQLEYYDGTYWETVGALQSSSSGQWLDISNGVPQNCPTATGSANAYVVSYTPAPTKEIAGQRYCFYTNFSPTGSSTMNPNSLGAMTLTKFGQNNLETGDLANPQQVVCIYDGTDCEIVSQLGKTTGSGALVRATLPTFNGSLGFTSTASAPATGLAATSSTTLQISEGSSSLSIISNSSSPQFLGSYSNSGGNTGLEVQNSNTAANTIASLNLYTGTSNAYASLQQQDGTTPQEILLSGSGDTGGIFIEPVAVGAPILLGGHVAGSLGTTLLPTCGSGCSSVTSGSTDFRGQLTSGSGQTSITLTFGTAYPGVPFCMTQDDSSNALTSALAVTTTSFTISTASVTSAKFTWICLQ